MSSNWPMWGLVAERFWFFLLLQFTCLLLDKRTRNHFASISFKYINRLSQIDCLLCVLPHFTIKNHFWKNKNSVCVKSIQKRFNIKLREKPRFLHCKCLFVGKIRNRKCEYTQLLQQPDIKVWSTCAAAAWLYIKYQNAIVTFWLFCGNFQQFPDMQLNNEWESGISIGFWMARVCGFCIKCYYFVNKHASIRWFCFH